MDSDNLKEHIAIPRVMTKTTKKRYSKITSRGDKNKILYILFNSKIRQERRLK